MSEVKTCEICSAPATVFLTQIINGKSTKVALCAKCAKAKGVLDPSAFDLAEQMFSADLPPTASTPVPNSPMEPQPVTTSLPLTVCPNCQFTIEDYHKVGRLGCSRCYEVFSEEIIPLLAKIQNGLSHVGKRPVHATRQVQIERDVSLLKTRLDAAIQREDYEEAARLRDSIKLIETAE